METAFQVLHLKRSARKCRANASSYFTELCPPLKILEQNSYHTEFNRNHLIRQPQIKQLLLSSFFKCFVDDSLQHQFPDVPGSDNGLFKFKNLKKKSMQTQTKEIPRKNCTFEHIACMIIPIIVIWIISKVLSFVEI